MKKKTEWDKDFLKQINLRGLFNVPAPRQKNCSGTLTGWGDKIIYKALCFGVAQGQMNGAPNETRTHSCRFASLSC